ncbi:MAG: tetratricopeptide repeat protein [Chloroflexota bacterium]
MAETRETPKHLRRVNAALSLREVPDYEAALEQLLKAQQEAPRDVDVLLALGLTYQDLDRPDEAEASLRAAIGLAPDDESVRAALAGLLTSQRRQKEAISLLKPFIERGTSNTDIWYHYANAFLQNDENDAFPHLLQEAETAFAPDPLPPAIVERLWHARAKQTDPWRQADEALKIAEEGLQTLPENKTLRRLRAQALVYLGRYEEGLKAIEEVQAAGTSVSPRVEYLAHLGVGQSYDASILASRIQGNGIDFHSAAIDLFAHGKTEGAAIAAEAALKYQRTALEDEFALDVALFLAHGGKSDAARALVEQVLAGEFYAPGENVEPPEWYLDALGLRIYAESVLAIDALLHGRYQEAINHYQKAAAHPQIRDSVVRPLPVVCCYKGRLTKPIVPSYDSEASVLRTIRANLATAYCLAGDTSSALEMARLAVQTEPDYPEIANEDAPYGYMAYAVLGCVHLAAGDPDDARQAWQRALALLEDEPEMEEATTLLQQWLNDL